MTLDGSPSLSGFQAPQLLKRAIFVSVLQEFLGRSKLLALEPSEEPLVECGGEEFFPS